MRNNTDLIKLESSSFAVRRKSLSFLLFLPFFLFSNLIIVSIYMKFEFPVVITNSMQQFSSWQVNSSSLPHYMEPEGSLLSLQEPASYLHPEPDQSSPQLPSYYLNIQLNTIIPVSTCKSFKWPLSFRYPHQNPICTSCCHTLTQRNLLSLAVLLVIKLCWNQFKIYTYISILYIQDKLHFRYSVFPHC